MSTLWKWWGVLATVVAAGYLAWMLIRNPRLGRGQGRVLVLSAAAAFGAVVIGVLLISVLSI